MQNDHLSEASRTDDYTCFKVFNMCNNATYVNSKITSIKQTAFFKLHYNFFIHTICSVHIVVIRIMRTLLIKGIIQPLSKGNNVNYKIIAFRSQLC